MLRNIISLILIAVLIAHSSIILASQADQDLEYSHIKLDDVTCDVGIAYRKAPYGMDIAVSAIALGKFGDFRRWRVEKIKLRIGDARIRPDKCGKFFVRKSSFWKYPAAVLWAVIGSQYKGFDGASTFAEGIGKVGMALGLGLLTLQATGDIPGELCTFYLKGGIADSISYGVDSVRIEIKNQDTNETEDIVVPLTREPRTGHDSKFYGQMTKDELSSKLGQIEGEIAGLESDLNMCKSSIGAQCGEIQSKIDGLRVEQAIVYRALADK